MNGIPGAGKTTTARALARRLERAAHIEGDYLQSMIVSGGVWPGEEPAAEAERQIHLNVHNQCTLARSFVQAGFTPVLDYVVVSKERVAEYKRELEGLEVRLVTLAPGVDVALRRDRDRPDKTVAHLWAHLDEIIRSELAGVGLWLDNSELTVDEAVDAILAQRERARV